MTPKKNKWLVGLIKNSLRIICFFLFIHWIFWITTYANCTNYRDSINKSIEQNTPHKEPIEYGYKKFGKIEEKTIEGIEEDILKMIETKKNVTNLLREWKKNQFPILEKLNKEIEQLRNNQHPILSKKQQEYEEKLKSGKEATIKNIHKQLEKNELIISELDDGRGWFESLRKDPINFFFLFPLNKMGKKFGKHLKLEKHLWVEIIFKLIIIKLIYHLVAYSEAKMTDFQENAERLQNPNLSMEEKEQISQEVSPLTKYLIFNGMMFFLLNILVTFVHPAFLDRTNHNFYRSASLIIWVPLLIFSGFMSSISGEFSRQERILNFREIKDYLTKHWILIFVISPLFSIIISVKFGQVHGVFSFAFLSGIVDFFFNIIKLSVFKKTQPKIHINKKFSNS